MHKRQWKRTGRVYRFFNASATVQSVIFGAPDDVPLWAWGVWADKFAAEGIEGSLKRAKRRANETMDGMAPEEK